MKKLFEGRLFWLIVGLIVGAIITIASLTLTESEIAPVDMRDYKDSPNGVLIATATKLSTDRFLQDAPTQFPVSDRFTIEMEHNDPGMLITDYSS